ncbi:MAG: MarR family transcriptional regulator [Acidobacteria bacterium]|nr:MarR family transcriptional regulator [Acidobacteriota bacterium]
MAALTPPQARTLRQLADFDGPVTVRELASALGYRSTNAAHEHLVRLRRKGLLLAGRRFGVAAGWIPAAVMLPDDEIDVLCFWRGTAAHEIHAIAYMVAGSWFDSRTGERMDVPPTHWRNLPEPPP